MYPLVTGKPAGRWNPVTVHKVPATSDWYANVVYTNPSVTRPKGSQASGSQASAPTGISKLLAKSRMSLYRF